MLFWGLAHRPLCGSIIAGQYTLSVPLDYVFDHYSDEEERGQETGRDEEVSEAQDGIENNPDQDMTDEEESSDEEPIWGCSWILVKAWKPIPTWESR